MGGIQRVKYETDNKSIFNVLLDDSNGIKDLIGEPPSAEYTENMTISVSKNKRESGIEPRKVLLTRKINDGAADANCLVQTAERYKRVPIPTKQKWDEIKLQSEVTIAGTKYKVAKKLQEYVV